MKKPRKSLFILLALIAVCVFSIWFYGSANAPGHKSDTANKTSSGGARQFDKNKYSLNDPASIWVVVNKGRQLPPAYVPADLVVPGVPLRLGGVSEEMHMRRSAADALRNMFTAADSQGLHLMLASGYRSFGFQAALYGSYVRKSGQAAADTYSARPGFSEHQTGLAADVEPGSRVCEVDQCFDNTPEGRWLAANAYKYGFIIRYPKGKDSITGYEYEPWHVRYVGIELAAQIHSSGQTLEQFFGLPLFSGYSPSPYQLQTRR